MVYQDLALAGNLPIHENIHLGRELGREPGRKVLGFTVVDERLSREMAMDHLDRLNITVRSVDQRVEELSGQSNRVEHRLRPGRGVCTPICRPRDGLFTGGYFQYA